MDPDGKDAITEFNKVLNLNPTDKVAINYMALAYFEKGKQSFEIEGVAAAGSPQMQLKNAENCLLL